MKKEIWIFLKLCEELQMYFVCDAGNEYIVRKGIDGKNHVYIKDDNENLKLFDDRGDLFVALRNVAVNLAPDSDFRNDDYIYGR